MFFRVFVCAVTGMDLGSMCFLEQFDGLLDGIGECSTLDQGDGKAKKTWEADDTRYTSVYQIYV